ncbi:MAG TPA: phospholipase D-like domain-containing protein [Humisphaera sp.]
MPYWLIVVAVLSMAVVALLLVLLLFEPGLAYKATAPDVPVDSDAFLCVLGALVDAEVHDYERVEVPTNGDVFYEAELAAIRAATSTVHMERYIFAKGDVAKRYVDALAERARAGVRVKLVLDYIGSFSTWDAYLEPLRAAGGQVCWYQPVSLANAKRFNNRTHRELLVVDGKVGFVGGAGVADWWFRGEPKKPQWRDTMFRLEGDILLGLQTTFAENWLESSGEILPGDADHFPACRGDGWATDRKGESGLVVISSPGAGRATRARILFQVLLASATRTIDITTPYFLPDRSAIREMVRAVKERGVRVRILVPGEHADHLMTRRAGRRRYGPLLEAGAEIHEYGPSMIHAKILVVDGVWCVFGTANFDNRSFGLNDEVNVAINDRELAERLAADHAADLSRSHRVTLEEWRRRPLTERVVEWASRVLERQS